MENKEIITEKELADKFATVNTIEGCKEFTNYVYMNVEKLGQELYQRAIIVVNEKRKEIETESFKEKNSFVYTKGTLKI